VDGDAAPAAALVLAAARSTEAAGAAWCGMGWEGAPPYVPSAVARYTGFYVPAGPLAPVVAAVTEHLTRLGGEATVVAAK
jgi:hypothetical protein